MMFNRTGGWGYCEAEIKRGSDRKEGCGGGGVETEKGEVNIKPVKRVGGGGETSCFTCGYACQQWGERLAVLHVAMHVNKCAVREQGLLLPSQPSSQPPTDLPPTALQSTNTNRSLPPTALQSTNRSATHSPPIHQQISATHSPPIHQQISATHSPPIHQQICHPQPSNPPTDLPPTALQSTTTTQCCKSGNAS